jgi:hypothetical protein
MCFVSKTILSDKKGPDCPRFWGKKSILKWRKTAKNEEKCKKMQNNAKKGLQGGGEFCIHMFTAEEHKAKRESETRFRRGPVLRKVNQNDVLVVGVFKIFC